MSVKTEESGERNSEADGSLKLFSINKSDSDPSNLVSDSSESHGQTTMMQVQSGAESSCSDSNKSADENSESTKSFCSGSSGEEVNLHRLLEQFEVDLSHALEYYNSSDSSDCSDFSECSDDSDDQSVTDTEFLDGSHFDHDNPSRHLYDAHLPLIQSIEFNPVISEEQSTASDSLDEGAEEHVAIMSIDTPQVTYETRPDPTPVDHTPAFTDQRSVDSSDQLVCIQCCAWPDAQKFKDQTVHYNRDCYHTPSSPLECAFGGTVNYLTLTLTDINKDPDAIEKRQSLESALKSIFFLLINQFEDNPGDIARLLYGISVIDLHDLNVATTWSIPVINRAEILAVTLVRRLRHSPDSFEDVCKVLTNVPALRIANNKMQLTGLEQSASLLETIDENPDADSISDLNHDSDVFSRSCSIDQDIISEDAVSHGSRLSVSSAKMVEYQPKDTCKTKKNQLLLHQCCLVNRSTKSLDALIASEELDIDSKDQNGRTPLLIACLCLPSEPSPRITKKQREKIKTLVNNGADTTIQDYDGNTPLHIAALRRDSEVLNLLLHKALTTKFFICTTNKNGRTALHYACFWGDLELLLPLFETERDHKSGLVNSQDRNGDTGLHIASRRGFKKAVNELMKANANRELKNVEGKTAADVAKENKNYKIARKLEKTKSLWHFSLKKPGSGAPLDHSNDEKVARSHYSSSPHFDGSEDGMSSGESDLEEENRPDLTDGFYD